MGQVNSIRHSPEGQRLPNFRNLGVMLRILLGVNLMAAAAALVMSAGVADWLQQYVGLAAWVQPVLLLSLCLLALIGPLLLRLPVWPGRGVIVALVSLLAALFADIWQLLGLDFAAPSDPLKSALLAACAAIALLTYFDLRMRAFSPAIAEARLQALTARIRPHFLFNSLNAVLSLIRADPHRAETALEELAELFRVLMRDPRNLLPLADEIALCRQYLNLEKLRLGDRLRVKWKLIDVPQTMRVPPLMLQPLLENAVYHGIEPISEGGTIRLRLMRRGNELHIDMSNPCTSDPADKEGGKTSGHQMALANIRERLALYYDLEARLETRLQPLHNGQHEFRVHILLPCRSEEL